MFKPAVLYNEGKTFTFSAGGPFSRKVKGLGDYFITKENTLHCDRPVYRNRHGYQLYSTESGAWAVSGTTQELSTCGKEDRQPFMMCTTEAPSPELCQQWLFKDPDDGNNYNHGYISVVVKK